MMSVMPRYLPAFDFSFGGSRLTEIDSQASRTSVAPNPRQTVDDLDMFVAGEAEVDEPLAVKHPRRLLQQRNPPPVVLDQVVVGERIDDDLLLIACRETTNLEQVQHIIDQLPEPRLLGLDSSSACSCSRIGHEIEDRCP